MKMTENDIKTLINLWNDRVSVRIICQILPYTQYVIRRTIQALKENGTLVEENRIINKGYKIVIAYNNGIIDIDKLAELFTCTTVYVRFVLRRNGIVLERKKGYKKKPYNIAEKKQAIIDELKSGKSQSEIARQFGFSRQYISQINKEIKNNKYNNQ